MLARRCSTSVASDGWLSLRRERRRAFITGATVEQIALDVCSGDPAPLTAILREWRSALHTQESLALAQEGTSPFAARPGRSSLPPDHLDVVLGNFVRRDTGAIEFIDAEWRADAPVDAALVMFRGLWWFAFELVTHGLQHPWGAEATVHDVAHHLADLAGVPNTAITLDAFLAAEADFQSRVYGGDATMFERTLREYASRTQTMAAVTHPSTRLLDLLETRNQRVHELTSALDTARQELDAHERVRREGAERLQDALEIATRRAVTIAEIYASRSWRWTAWTRRLGTIVRGRRP